MIFGVWAVGWVFGFVYFNLFVFACVLLRFLYTFSVFCCCLRFSFALDLCCFRLVLRLLRLVCVVVMFGWCVLLVCSLFGIGLLVGFVCLRVLFSGCLLLLFWVWLWIDCMFGLFADGIVLWLTFLWLLYA